MDEKELKENVPEKDIEELLQWWHQEENAQDGATVEEEATPAENTTPDEEAVPEKRPSRRNTKTGWQGTLLMYLHDLVYLLSGLILVFLLLFRVVIVSGTSMNNTLLDGDYLCKHLLQWPPGISTSCYLCPCIIPLLSRGWVL